MGFSKTKLLAGLLLAPLALGKPCGGGNGCHADNCLRALRKTIGSELRGAADCSTYFVTTVIPPTYTITATSTVSNTAFSTEDVAQTSTVYTTITTVVDATSTDVIDVTVTASEHTEVVVTADETATTDLYSTLTQTDYATATDTIDVVRTSQILVTYVQTDGVTETVTASPPAVTITARGLDGTTTLIPDTIPTYASACSGSDRYSSACSCIGATAKTVTLPTPSETVTVGYTVTPVTVTETVIVSVLSTVESTATVYTTDSTETEYTTVATTTETIIDGTSTYSLTVSTATDLIIESTKTQVIVDATNTLTITTATVGVPTTVATRSTTVTVATTTVAASTPQICSLVSNTLTVNGVTFGFISNACLCASDIATFETTNVVAIAAVDVFGQAAVTTKLLSLINSATSQCTHTS